MADTLRYWHASGRAQHWDTADADIAAFVNAVVEGSRRVLVDAGFVGAYLHGSLSQGSYYRAKSDLDVLFVVDRSVDNETRRCWAEEMCDYSDERPTLGDIETSVLLRSSARDFVHPLPYEVHFSEEWKTSIRDGSRQFDQASVDPDLAAHIMIVCSSGVVLDGAPIGDVFGVVSTEDFRDAAIDDVRWIVSGENLVESPFYGVLNCCRFLAHERIGWEVPMSKEAGAEWALEAIDPIHQPIVAQALECYRSDEPVDPASRRTDGHDWDTDGLIGLRDEVRSLLGE